LPIVLLVAVILIAIGWSIMGWILLIGDLLFFTTLFANPTDYETVKKNILQEIEKENKERLENERLEKERKDKIEKYGCAFQNTELLNDEFSDTTVITTKLYDKFKQDPLNSVSGVGQTVQLYYNKFTMRLGNIEITRGLWASVKLEQKNEEKKYLLEFHYRYEKSTRDKEWSNKPSAEDCVLDIAASNEKHNVPSNLIRNDKEQRDFTSYDTKMKIKQTFNFEIKPKVLKLITKEECKMRLSNFRNVGKEGTNLQHIHPLGGEPLSKLKRMVSEFCTDLNL
jgi:hypothetical protein